MGIEIKKAIFEGFGTRLSDKGLYVSCSIKYLNKSGLYIYDPISHDIIYKIEFEDSFYIGDVVCLNISGIDFDGLYYNYYRDEEIFVDPYARLLSDSKKYGVFVKERNVRGFSKDTCPMIPASDSVFYITHVKGQTALDKKVKKDKGTFKALESKRLYFKELGITSVILMPVYELIPEKNLNYRIKENEKLPNYWGFGQGYYFALKKEFLTEDSDSDFKNMIMAYHKVGLEIILIMNFNEYQSSTYIESVLNFYVLNYHVDGFRIIGNINLDSILDNPFLSNTKLLIENADYVKSIGRRNRNKNVYFVDSDFMNEARSFAKSDEDKVPYLSYAVRSNSQFYTPVRFISDFYGFSLWDTVSYNQKHNESNLEANTDGTEYNHSWNCGVEGETGKTSVLKLRNRQSRNMYLISMLCQGVPMLKAGDEWLNTQYGNNNPYCQDNDTSYVKFKNSKMNKDFYDFTKNLLAFRKRHVVLHQQRELRMFDYMSCGLPDVSFHGVETFKMDMTPVSRSFGVLYAGPYSKQYTKKEEQSIFIIFNMFWEDKEFELPFGEKGEWKLVYSTDGSTDQSFDETKAVSVQERKYLAKSRSVSVLVL